MYILSVIFTDVNKKGNFTDIIFFMEFNINLKIRKLRKELGLLQKEFAEKIGVKEYTIGDWERSRSTPSMEDLRKIFLIFEIDANDFFELNKSEK